jgi:hypothetical protein
VSLRVVGAGLPRTGTSSLKAALERLLGGRCFHMAQIPGHPFNLGTDWETALSDGAPDWHRMLEGFVQEAVIAAYERHNDHVRSTASPNRPLEWQPGDGWGPICGALELPVPDESFPWLNKREDWGTSS